MDLATTAMRHLRDHAPLCACGQQLAVAGADHGPVLVCAPCSTVTPLDGELLARLRDDALARAETETHDRAPTPVPVRPVVRLYRNLPPFAGRRDVYAYHCQHCGSSWKTYQTRLHVEGCPNDTWECGSQPPPHETWRPWEPAEISVAS
jgi:hypothetical protein